jgi:hypothetical protein
MSRRSIVSGLAALVALAMACTRQSTTPSSPTALSAVSSDAAADGSTLKVSAPVPTSPVNDQALSDTPTLSANVASLKFGSAPAALTYRFQVFNPSNTQVVDSGQQSSPTYRVATDLAFKTRHTWRVRAELGNDVGPWSAVASFVSSEGGYIRGNEVFDPLTNAVTVGQVVGPVTFSPEGAKLETVGSYIRYQIPQTITSGEFAVEIKGLRANEPGDKSKVFGMMEGSPDGGNDYITNRYRVDVQYRGTTGFPPNSITYRVLYGSADDLNVRYEPTTEQRLSAVRALDPNTYYYWRYTWGRTVRVTVQAGGPNGPFIYDVQRNSGNGSYNPQPHYAFIGTPAGRSGAESATIPGTIYKNVWISTRPRP